tara:strand:- start:173 stop:532 length:360 start_codon:yes stop_codon:yes gene_type:complete
MPWKYNGQTVSETKGFRKTDGYMTPKNWNAVWNDTEKKNQGLTWEDPTTSTPSDTEIAAAKLAGLRALRNEKLQQTDWRASSDLTLSTAWKNYRQSLRDITNTYSSIDAEGFAWPTEPS